MKKRPHITVLLSNQRCKKPLRGRSGCLKGNPLIDSSGTCFISASQCIFLRRAVYSYPLHRALWRAHMDSKFFGARYRRFKQTIETVFCVLLARVTSNGQCVLKLAFWSMGVDICLVFQSREKGCGFMDNSCFAASCPQAPQPCYYFFLYSNKSEKYLIFES